NALALNGSPTVTTGIVSALNRQIETENGVLSHLIQTDAPINHGNSGGPLLNADGQVIGMNTDVAGDAQNIAFAIAINEIKPNLNNLESGKTAQSTAGFLGVQSEDATDGAGIAAVEPGSPADKAGLQAGDTIIAVDGQQVGSASDLVG